jgi:hypothetical protein
MNDNEMTAELKAALEAPTPELLKMLAVVVEKHATPGRMTPRLPM